MSEVELELLQGSSSIINFDRPLCRVRVMVESGANAGEGQQQSTQGAGALQDLRIELIDDNIILNEEFKKNVAIPYFKDIYKDLSAQSDAKAKGVNKVSILNVSLAAQTTLTLPLTLPRPFFVTVQSVARRHWRALLRCA